MLKSIVTLILTITHIVSFSQETEKNKDEVVSDFIQCFKNHDKVNLSAKVFYPFNREYPLPEIKNKQAFLERFNEVFDDSLIKMIVNSKPSEDWSQVGWRGIMLFNGVLWLDEDGSLMSVNYESTVETKKREALIKADKKNLHASIKEFKRPMLVLETTKYRIRIDDLGDNNYRFASWPLKNKMSNKPDLIIENGKWIPEGSGGDYRYEFKNGDYIYDCSILITGPDDSPPAMLTININDKEILSQHAKIIRK